MNFAHRPQQPPRRSVSVEDRPPTAVLWVFRDYDDRWCVRREGANGVKSYPCRSDALEAARLYGRAWGSYHIFLELKDGRVTQERFNLRSTTAESGGRYGDAS